MHKTSVYKTTVPRVVPNIPADTSVFQRNDTTNIFNTDTKNYLICQKIENFIKKTVEKSLESVYIADIHSKTLEFGVRTVHYIFQHLYQTYREITLNQINENLSSLNTQVPTHLLLIIILK